MSAIRQVWSVADLSSTTTNLGSQQRTADYFYCEQSWLLWLTTDANLS
jgi:hypothetical protein